MNLFTSSSIKLVLLTCLAFNLGCAVLSGNRAQQDEEWFENPEIALALSEAIRAAMHHLLEIMPISDAWFENTPISIVSEDRGILDGTITHFCLRHAEQQGVFSRWHIYRTSNDHLNHVNTLYFDSSEAPGAAADSLFLNIYETSAKFRAGRDKDLSGIKVIFWLDSSEQQPVATIEFIRDKSQKYTLVCPVPSH